MANFTEQAIETAFLQLLDERPMNRIGVRDISERCGINRKPQHVLLPLSGYPHAYRKDRHLLYRPAHRGVSLYLVPGGVLRDSIPLCAAKPRRHDAHLPLRQPGYF